jgi:hypothetical protein
MANPDWYPPKLADRIPWHANYNVNAQATGTTYGLSAGDKTDILNDAANVPLVVNFKEAVAAYAQAVTEWAAAILDGPIGTAFPPIPTAPTPPTFALGSKPSIQPRTRVSGGVVKADADYTKEIGEAYGIVAPAPGPLADPSIQTATPTPGTSQVVLGLFKGGYGVIAVDMRRAGGGWVQIGISQTATFTDTTPPLVAGQPEQREYRVQGMLNNARTGGLSATVSAVTVP